MNTMDYFKHAREIGAFSAADCLALAREAAALDEAAEIKKIPLPAVVGYESAYGVAMPFSRGIKVY